MKFRFFAIAALVVAPFIAAADPIQTQTALPAASAYNPRAATSSANRSGATAATQPVSGRAVATRSQTVAAANQTAGRNIASRSVANRAGMTTPSQSARVVRARTGATTARASVTGTPLTKRTDSTLLYNTLRTNTYSNLLDPTTGLISADAYSNCLDSYYACMDEICTARNPGQRRCACAGRVVEFNSAEQQLVKANEEFVKVNGELNLLVMSKGEDITTAFTLTDAEKGLNCVSYRDAYRSGDKADLIAWCENHKTSVMADYGTLNCETWAASATAPKYCTDNNFGWDADGGSWMDFLNGADSDIIASMRTAAAAYQNVNTFTDNNGNLLDAFNYLDGSISSLFGGGSSVSSLLSTSTGADKLAQTWGYDLMVFAHNNVCNRVLNACFNGIYEKCSGNTASNYNDKLSTSDGGKNIVVQTPTETTTNGTTNAACFGYSSSDPYYQLRKPVADARRSVVQKYILDANADCDVYGSELQNQIQKMTYAKAEIQQVLQQKRLEFAQEKETATASSLAAAKTEFQECMNEILDCYASYDGQNYTKSWIQGRCSQKSYVSSCYEPMVCDLGAIDYVDETTATKTGKARNTVTITEIIQGSANTTLETCLSGTSLIGPKTGGQHGTIRGWVFCNASQQLNAAGTACEPKN